VTWGSRYKAKTWHPGLSTEEALREERAAYEEAIRVWRTWKDDGIEGPKAMAGIVTAWELLKIAEREHSEGRLTNRHSLAAQEKARRWRERQRARSSFGRRSS